MIKTEKATTIWGFILLIMAAFFLATILFNMLPGTNPSGITGFFFSAGKILYQVYGFSSLLIPVFFFAAGISCFTESWSNKKGFILCVSILPFFTIAGVEKICRTICSTDSGPLLTIKIAAIVTIAILLIIVEYAAAVVIGSRIESRQKIQKQPMDSLRDYAQKIDDFLTAEQGSPDVPADTDSSYIPEHEETEQNCSVSSDFPADKKNEVDLPGTVLQDRTISIEEAEAAAGITADKIESGIPANKNEQQEFPEPICTSNTDDFSVTSQNPVSNTTISSDEKPEDTAHNFVSDFLSKEQPDRNISIAEAEAAAGISTDELPLETTEFIFAEQHPTLYSKDSSDLYNDEEAAFLNDPFDSHFTGDETENQNTTDVLQNETESYDDTTDTVWTNPVSNSSIPAETISESETGQKKTKELPLPCNNDSPETFTVSFTQTSDACQDEDYISLDELAEARFNAGLEGGLDDEIEEEEEETDPDFPARSEQEDDWDDTETSDEAVPSPAELLLNQTETPAAPLVERAVPARKKNAPYQVPTEGLLTSYPDGEYWVIDDETLAAAGELKDTLSEFKIEAEVTGIRKGPVITMFEILPAPGVKLSKIVALQDNIALRLAASSVRIVAPIPGKHAVGIEVPNKERAIVSFKELIETDAPAFRKYAVPVILGKDITGEAKIIDLAKTPHLLIAGSTGSGKSVCVNTMILSILYKRSPQDVKMILIDPKIVELKLYNDIPHLLTPVITEPKKAFQALQYCLCEMERRYALLDGMGVREIGSYNRRIVERNIAAEKLPYVVVIIDEFADLMATTGKELESTVARLAAMSRAVGIHLVLATQRPSIDVITGLIKANIPTRIAFMVASKMDSRIIIDQVGAEKLLGKGDMLYASATDPFPVRIQGTFVSDTEVENVVEFVKQYGEPEYIDDEIFVDDEEDLGPSLFSDGDDPLYDQALEIVIQAGKASASYIQRRLKIGYNRAARLVEEMEARGIVGPANGSKPRDILQVP